MLTLVAAAGWDDGTLDRRRLSLVIDRLAAGARTAKIVSTEGHFVAAAWAAPGERADVHLVGVTSRTGRCIAIGAARIDRRDDVLDAIGESDPDARSDLDVLVLAYEHWGTGFASHVDGEYAAVLWDKQDERLVAVRDPFGSIPLVYGEDGRKLYLSTDLEPIVRLMGGTPRPDDRMVLEYLLQDVRDRTRTFFRGIRRIVPGHVLSANRRLTEQHRYWYPPETELNLAKDDVLLQYSTLFRRSTARQMRGTRRIVVEVSGGLDSSSVAAMAVELARAEGCPGRCALFHQEFPGLDCDESAFANAMERHLDVPIQRVTLTGNVHSGLAQQLFACPPGRGGLGHEYFEALRAHGAQVVLGGEGGDSLNYETAAFTDLAATRDWKTLVRELVPLPAYGPTRWSYWAKVVGLGIVPAPLRSFRRRITRRAAMPRWLGASLRPVWIERDLRARQAPNERGVDYLSNIQRSTWNALTNPMMEWVLDAARWMYRWAGVEVRHPFFDPALSRLVLALPPQQRLPGGLMKRLLRDAMGDMLPPIVRQRKRCTIFDSYSEVAIPRMISKLLPELRASSWSAEPYVSRDTFTRSLYSRRGSQRELSVHTLWLVATLELWLRGATALPA